MKDTIIKTPRARVKRIFFDNVSGYAYHSISDIPRQLEINHETTKLFIRLGYVTGNETLFKGIQCLPGGATIQIKDRQWKVIEQFCYGDLVNKNIYHDMPESALIKLGRDKWLNVLDNLYDKQSDIVVPISGGLDSRAILAGLVEFTDAYRIKTYTFGLPGTYDFEIGNQVARRAGTRHTCFDLSQFHFTDEILSETSRQTDGNINIFMPAFSLPIVESYGAEAVFWSGFMGDPLAGSHIPKRINKDIEKAKNDYYVREAKKICGHLKFDFEKYDWISFLNHDTFLSPQILLDEQLDFYLRQERSVANGLFFKNSKYVTPFIEDEWVMFILSLPLTLRIGKRFYRIFLKRIFSFLFNIPTKETCGLSLGASKMAMNLKRNKIRAHNFLCRGYLHPNTNYIDFNKELKIDSPLKREVQAHILDLKSRGLIENQFLDSLWKEHQADKKNNALILMNCASLEIIIKTFNVKC